MPKIDIVPFADTDIQLGLLLAVLDNVTDDWKEQLGNVPDDIVRWQAFPNGHGIGILIFHIADVEAY